MTSPGRRINCDNYPWIARHLNKPHHEIENDPLVWEQIRLADRQRTREEHRSSSEHVFHFYVLGMR